MLKSNKIAVLILTGFTLALAGSCRKDYLYMPPPPHTSQPSATLVANFVSTPPNELTSPYWNTADYLKVTSQNMSTKQLYGDGFMNMTGTYLGLASFDNSLDPGLELKAAYDANNIYILAQWTDPQVDPGYGRWFYNGPVDPLKSDPDSAWTMQSNCDRFALAFEIQTASSTAGSFSSVGCQAACHAGSSAVMHPDAGIVDIWNWNLAHSAPLGYAEDMVANSTGLSDDGGTPMWAWNRKGSSSRSGPAFEWNDSTQNIKLANGLSSILNPAYYLYKKDLTPFLGDPAKGDSIFHRATQPGECYTCHGSQGQGATEQAINSINEGAKGRASIISNMNNNSDMGPYISGLNTTDFNNLIAYIKGFSGGTPGTYLQTPTGSNADIIAISNVTPSQITNASSPSKNIHTKYQVLIIRKLNTGNPDDIQFVPTTTKMVKFGVALMNKDGANHIGSAIETLTFK